jgi:integrase
MATIHKRKTGGGDVVWELTHGTGSDRQRFVAGRSKQEAEAVLAQFTRQLALHGEAPDNITVTDAVAQYVEYLGTNRRKSTQRRYARVLQTFDGCFLKVFHYNVATLRDVKPAHLEDYKERRLGGQITEPASREAERRDAALRAKLEANPKSATPRDNAAYGWLGRKRLRVRVTPRTVNYELRALHTFFHWAIRKNYLVVNPAISVERLRIPKRALPKFMTSDDLRRFFAACSEDERRLFMAILLTGMRKGEAEFLTWDDVSLELGVIFIREKPELEWQPKTDERIIPISPVLAAVLAEQRAQSQGERWVFANRAGGRDTHMLEKVKKVCRRAGIKAATVHALRHSFGAHLRMAGVSLADIADLLGHKDLATTQVYAKVHQEHLRQAVAKLAPLVGDDRVLAARTKWASRTTKEE